AIASIDRDRQSVEDGVRAEALAHAVDRQQPIRSAPACGELERDARRVRLGRRQALELLQRPLATGCQRRTRGVRPGRVDELLLAGDVLLLAIVSRLVLGATPGAFLQIVAVVAPIVGGNAVVQLDGAGA